MSMYIGCSFTFFRSWWNTGQKYRFSSIVELLCIFGHLDGLKSLDILVSGFLFFCFVLLSPLIPFQSDCLSSSLSCFMQFCRVESVSNENNFYLRVIKVWVNVWVPLFCLDTIHRISFVLHHVQNPGSGLRPSELDLFCFWRVVWWTLLDDDILLQESQVRNWWTNLQEQRWKCPFNGFA